MKKKILVSVIIVLILTLCLLGCSKGDTVADVSPGLPGNGGNEEGGFNIDNVSERKIIYYVNMQISVKNVNEANTKILAKLNGSEFMESQKVSESYSTLVLRIKTDRLNEFIASIETEGTVVSRTMTAEDISNRYYDRQLKIETLNITRARYEELIKNATTTELITLFEKIDQIDAELKKLNNEQNIDNSLVEYSVVTLELQKDFATEELSFGQRLGQSFKDGFVGFGNFLEGLIYFLVRMIPLIIILVIVIVIIVVVKKHKNKRK